MSSSRWERFAPLSGVVFFVLIAVTFALANDTPGTDKSTAETVSYWSAHDTRLIVSAVLGTLAVIFLTWFAGTLRSALLRAEGGEGRLSMLAFAGILTIAISGGIASALQFTAADTVNDVPATVTQTISVLNEDFFFPFVAGGVVLMFASALATFRFGALPRWLGWASIVIGILSIAGPAGFIGFLLTIVWILVVSVVLYMQGAQASATPAAAPPAPPAS
jgi:hypothetical protein